MIPERVAQAAKEIFESDEAREAFNKYLTKQKRSNESMNPQEIFKQIIGDRGKRLFTEASKKINGERQDKYGNPEDSFQIIAERWNQLLEIRHSAAFSLGPEDVALMMVDLKIARELYGPKPDNREDAVGYFGIYDDFQGKDIRSHGNLFDPPDK